MTLWPRAILHVDMDAFYTSVEQHDNPGLRGKPVIVGGSPRSRGVVSAASYEVRAYGVRSAMPTAKALRLCPHAILIPGRMERYQEVSRQVFAIFHTFTPLVQSVSLDEAFLDVTSSQRLHGDAVAIATRIRAAIKETTGLTASAGVAACRFVAKIASDLNKPDGLPVIPAEEMADRLGPLPVAKIWGVGPVTNRRLEKLGIATIAQLRDWPLAVLERELGKTGGDLHHLANGRDASEVVPDAEEKSLSHETTFPKDTLNRELLETTLRMLSDVVATRLRRHQVQGKVVCVKVRYSDFSLITRRQTLETPTDVSEVIFTIGRSLLRAKTAAGTRPIRLIGIGLTGLLPAGERQSRLFGDEENRKQGQQRRLEQVTDEIRGKFGGKALRRASGCMTNI